MTYKFSTPQKWESTNKISKIRRIWAKIQKISIFCLKCVWRAHHVRKRKKLFSYGISPYKAPETILGRIMASNGKNKWILKLFWLFHLWAKPGNNAKKWKILQFLHVTLQAVNTNLYILINIFRTENHCISLYLWNHDNTLFLFY